MRETIRHGRQLSLAEKLNPSFVYVVTPVRRTPHGATTSTIFVLDQSSVCFYATTTQLRYLNSLRRNNDRIAAAKSIGVTPANFDLVINHLMNKNTAIDNEGVEGDQPSLDDLLNKALELGLLSDNGDEDAIKRIADFSQRIDKSADLIPSPYVEMIRRFWFFHKI